jgi:citrate lyase subunit beta / citryl-CoA lyase
LEIIRSLLFVPSDNLKFINKIKILKSDAYILDLEDSVPLSKKIQARKNIKNKLEELNFDNNLKIFIRTNDPGTDHFKSDIEETINPKIMGYMIPKFENFNKLKDIINFITVNEKKKKISVGKMKLILMVESPKGIKELNKLNNLSKRIIAITIGWEDFTSTISVFTEITQEMLDFVRMTILLYAKANKILAIDTIYNNFGNDDGLKSETLKIIKIGFNGKLAIHPRQIEIINSCFTPTEDEIKRMEIIMENKDRIVREGAININGVMYDPPHLKWALMIKEYLNKIRRINN